MSSQARKVLTKKEFAKLFKTKNKDYTVATEPISKLEVGNGVSVDVAKLKEKKPFKSLYETIETEEDFNRKNEMHKEPPIVHYNHVEEPKQLPNSGYHYIGLENNTNYPTLSLALQGGAQLVESLEEYFTSRVYYHIFSRQSKKYDIEKTKEIQAMTMVETYRGEDMSFFNMFGFKRENLPKLIDYLASSVNEPIFAEKDIDEIVEQVLSMDQSLNADPTMLLNDLIIYAGWGQQMYTPYSVYQQDFEKALENFYVTKEALMAYHKKVMANNGLILGTGINPNYLDVLVNKQFGEYEVDGEQLSRHNELLKKPLQFTPQDVAAQSPDLGNNTLNSYSVVFESIPYKNKKDVVRVNILCSLLGNASIFMAGGPGKGISAIIPSEYVSSNPLQMMDSDIQILNNGGLFSITAQALSSDQNENRVLPAVIFSLLQNFKGHCTQEALDAARNRYLFSYFSACENAPLYSQTLASSYLAYDRFLTFEEIKEEAYKVTTDDLCEMWYTFLQQEPGVVRIGDTKKLPSKQLVDTAIGIIRERF